MTKKDFLKCMKEARRLVRKDLRGVCVALSHCFDWMDLGRECYYLGDKVADLFGDTYEESYPLGAYWLGHRIKENVPKRLEVLKDFENLLLETEMYKEL